MFAFLANSALPADAVRFRCTDCQVLRLTAAVVALLLLFPVAARAEWGGGLSASATETSSDSGRSSVLDQNYDAHVSGNVVPRLRYTGSMRFRLLHSDLDDALPVRYTELQPDLSAMWSSPYHTMRSNYQYREIRDDRNLNRFTARAAGTYLQTNSFRLPRLNARYEWNQNVNDLDLLGRDTRGRIFAAGARFDRRYLAMSYDYRDSETANRATGLKFSSQQHTGRLDNNLRLYREHLTLQSSYQITDRSERQRSSATGPVLISLPAIAGLHAVNPSPEFGQLLDLPALIDGNVALPASFEISLSGPDVHNFGLDFGAPLDVDRLFLNTDTVLVNQDLRWAVYVSSDNLSWQQVRGFAPAHFEPVFRRYEVEFPRQRARYIKLVVQPQPTNTPVYPTELRALLTRSDDREPIHSTDHRGLVNLQAVPTKWLQLGTGAEIVRTDGSLTAIARRQEGVHGNVRLHPHRWMDANFRASADRYGRGDNRRDQVDTDNYSASLQSNWLTTLTTIASANRTYERSDGRSTRRTDGTTLRANAQWLPGLAQLTEIGYLENHYTATGDVITTRYVAEVLDTRPVPSSVLRLEYRYYDMDATRSRVPAYRQIVAAYTNFLLTRVVTIDGDLSLTEEPRRTSRSASGGVTWIPTFKWIFSGSILRTDWSDQPGTTLYSAQAFFRWSMRTELNFSYAFTSYDQTALPDVSSARLGLTTRF